MTILSDEDFIKAWQTCGGSPRQMADITGLDERSIYKRRRALANKGIILQSNPRTSNAGSYGSWSKDDIGRAYRKQLNHSIDTGSVIVFSDAHWWPDQDITCANHALHELIRELRPVAMIANGDIFDGARISRHAPLGWAELPTVKQELEICNERLADIEMLLPPGCEKFWNIGNHDARFDRALVVGASEYDGIIERLEDKFDRWEMAWSLMINDKVMIKHRIAGGIHSGYNNALRGGLSVVTGHTHLLQVSPWSDYRGRRYGVSTGTLANPQGPQFDYTENAPSPACSGFAVLTFKDGMLLPPELCEVVDGTAYFRGQAVYSEKDGDA